MAHEASYVVLAEEGFGRGRKPEEVCVEIAAAYDRFASIGHKVIDEIQYTEQISVARDDTPRSRVVQVFVTKPDDTPDRF